MAERRSSLPRLLLVTGMSGAGKSTVLNALEDMGWDCVDNLPTALLEAFVHGERESRQDTPVAVGMDVRSRGFDPKALPALLRSIEGVTPEILYLDCAGAELIRRYDETRRRHPLAPDRPAEDGIARERGATAPLRQIADTVLDTTDFTPAKLRDELLRRYGGEVDQPVITVASFGFARGISRTADLVFDMRFLDNPHWDPELRELTGLDEGVGAHVEKDPAFASAFERIRDLVLELLPRYAAQGKRYVNVAFGCTGGRHRSVFVAERIAEALRGAGFSPTVLHRNLGSRAAEMIEGPHQP